ncbi:hypothetical protein ILUMI_00735 [Ignelater luminosus]|uniref:Uncharacterized protein n=1 Tax=Ignelater luminosus TaxID=2038154 RepID=A0A8K0GPX6_IGNLU|nr:hypothetical protein ILUMI_00735 [Ignelater luminosus]
MSGSGGMGTSGTKPKPTINKYCEDKPEFFEYHRKIEEAFQRDCEEFLQEYEKRKDFTLKTFSELWSQLDFESTSLAGQDLIEELPYFADSYFFIIRKFLKHGSNDYIKVGAFYLMHAIYSQQHKKSIIKIKLVLSEFTQLQELAARLLETFERDFDFILYKLICEEAFQFVAVERDAGLEPRFVWQELELKNDIFQKQIDPVKKIVKSVLDSESDIKGLSKVCQDYDKALKKYEEETGKIVRVQPQCTLVLNMEAELQKLKNAVSGLDDITVQEESESDNKDEDEND